MVLEEGADRCDRCDRWFVINCTRVCCLTNAEGFCFDETAPELRPEEEKAADVLRLLLSLRQSMVSYCRGEVVGEVVGTPCPCQGPNYLQQE